MTTLDPSNVYNTPYDHDAAAYLAGWNDAIDAAATAAEQQDKRGREWVHDSLWSAILKRAGDEVLKLKRAM